MREISSQEITQVAGGAGLGDIIGGIGSIVGLVPASTIGKMVGSAIGGYIDQAYTAKTGINTNAEAVAGGILGGGIGSMIDAVKATSEADINRYMNNAIDGISQGLFGVASGIFNGIKGILHI